MRSCRRGPKLRSASAPMHSPHRAGLHTSELHTSSPVCRPWKVPEGRSVDSLDPMHFTSVHTCPHPVSHTLPFPPLTCTTRLLVRNLNHLHTLHKCQHLLTHSQPYTPCSTPHMHHQLDRLKPGASPHPSHLSTQPSSTLPVPPLTCTTSLPSTAGPRLRMASMSEGPFIFQWRCTRRNSSTRACSSALLSMRICRV